MTALDTNVLIYACDKSDPRRQQIALDVYSRRCLEPSHGVSRVFPLTLPAASIFPRAQDLHLNEGVSFWDALIVAACLELGVQTVYSEDIPARDSFGPLKMINPFV